MSYQSASLLFKICVFNRCKHDLSHKQMFYSLSSLALLARKTFLYRCDYVRDFWEKNKASSTASSWLTLNCAERFDDVIHVHSSRDSATADVRVITTQQIYLPVTLHSHVVVIYTSAADRWLWRDDEWRHWAEHGRLVQRQAGRLLRQVTGWHHALLREFIVSARLPHVHTGAWNKGVRCNIIDDTVVTSQCTWHSSYM